MKVISTDLPEVLLIEPKVHGDSRGFFFEAFHAGRYIEAGIALPFVQDNVSRSSKGILRGLHFQEPYAQGKLVQVTRGAVFDVAVDIRRGSPNFGRWVGFELSEANHRQLWVPPGFAHGFCVTSEVAEFQYKCTAFYAPAHEHSIAWDDPDLAIAWPVQQPMLSTKDAAAPKLAEVKILPAYRPELSRAAG